jgi:GT2 family glycosyltransferase
MTTKEGCRENINREIIPIVATYGGRYHFLEQNIHALHDAGFKQAIIADNNPYPDILFYARMRLRLSVLFQFRNTGSAGGFAEALSFAQKNHPNTYVLLLDDDNLVSRNILEKLTVALKEFNKEPFPAILCYRIDRPLYQKLYNEYNSKAIFNQSSQFRSLNIFRILRPSPSRFYGERGQLAIPIAPYGGLCLNTESLKKSGLPDRNLFIYMDDYDFTIRLTRSGTEIRFSPEIIVKDMEQSWNMKGWAIFKLPELHPDLLFSTIRNSVYFELSYKVNSLIPWAINCILYSAIFIMTAIVKVRFEAIALYLKGIKAGIGYLKAKQNIY